VIAVGFQLSALARTALAPAMIRAMESRRPDSLFDDPFAQAFVDAAADELPAESVAAVSDAKPAAQSTDLGALFYSHAVLRTRFFDDYLARASVTQVVLLAAGLDTRAFRLGWGPGTTAFEVDLPELFAFKESVLAACPTVPGCRRVVVPADLREEFGPALRAAGFDPARPTAWLAEGLLVYLTAAEASGLLEAITALSAPGSLLAFEQNSLSTGDTRARLADRAEVKEYAKLWHGGLGEQTIPWLERHRWSTRVDEVTAVAARLDWTLPPKADGFYVTARLSR
jgi:methyltransferase (TIGR00027 family)